MPLAPTSRMLSGFGFAGGVWARGGGREQRKGGDDQGAKGSGDEARSHGQEDSAIGTGALENNAAGDRCTMLHACRKRFGST